MGIPLDGLSQMVRSGRHMECAYYFGWQGVGMSDPQNTNKAGAKPIGLQDLALLNQEIAALVRAGVPLESGLAMAGQAGAGAQEMLMLRLAQRLREGRSFADALQMEGAELPRLYRAVVVAGARTYIFYQRAIGDSGPAAFSGQRLYASARQ